MSFIVSTSRLSNWTTTRPGMVARSSGAMSTSGARVTSMPPTWMERWRGRPSMRAQSSSQRSQGERPSVEPRRRGGSGSSSMPPMLVARMRRSGTEAASARRGRARRAPPVARRRRARALVGDGAAGGRPRRRPGRAQVADGAGPAQLAHVVEQLGGCRAPALGRGGEELGEAAVRLQVAADHDRVVRLEGLGHAVHERPREAQRVAHLADRRAGPVGDEVADHAGVGRAVALVDVLDDLLAARRGEVDVHVRVGGAALVDEALEEELVADGVDARDAQGVGDDRVAGAAPTLRRDAALPAEAHEVPADEEELRQAGPLDDLQLVGHLLEHPAASWGGSAAARRRGRASRGRRRASPRRAPGSPGSGSARTRATTWQRAAISPLRSMPSSQARRHDGSVAGIARRQGRQLRAALEGVLGVGPAQVGAGLEVPAVADGDEHVLELAVRAQGVVDAVGHDRGQAGLVRQARQLRHEPVVVGQQVVLELDVELVPAPKSRHSRSSAAAAPSRSPARSRRESSPWRQPVRTMRPALCSASRAWLKRGTPLLPARCAALASRQRLV